MQYKESSPDLSIVSALPPDAHSGLDDRPLNVQAAAEYLGVSAQTVYLWVERKRIPHLRVMGRNIRFLKSDLESFRATFRQEATHGEA
ncbi:MAG: helix-turn-helix domain-containing protein [Bryobacteraceae bacterium]